MNFNFPKNNPNPNQNQGPNFNPNNNPPPTPKNISDFLDQMPQKMPFSIVEDKPNLIRDEFTKAIINMNIDEYENYKTLKKIKDAEYDRVESLESEMKNIKSDIGEIKEMLLRALSNGKQ